LLEIERISPGFLKERCRRLVGVGSPEHRRGFIAGERIELDPGEGALDERAFERAGQAC
jgi:hypothetical protein